ncbi:hypothetical protein [Methylorubrum aminovorans]
MSDHLVIDHRYAVLPRDVLLKHGESSALLATYALFLSCVLVLTWAAA